MVHADATRELHDRLRTLAVSDPRAAREAFCQVLGNADPLLESFLVLVSAPGEGRLRQLVANAVRRRPDKHRVVPWLRRWLNVEADEFTRNALAAALDGIDQTARVAETQAPGLPPAFVETYRYVAERLCHKVRNSMVGLDTITARLVRDVGSLGESPTRTEIAAAATTLREGLRRLSRVVEFDVGDDYFAWRRVPLVEWLKQMHAGYVAKYEAAHLTIKACLEDAQPAVRANDVLLETLFWNLWMNASQAVSGPCRITLEGTCERGRVEVLVLDSGPGLSAREASSVFDGSFSVFSTKGPGRGRGLLEAHDAATRLQGAIELVRRGRDEFRFRVVLPEDNA